VHGVVTEATAAVSEPQCWGVGQAVLAAESQVAVQGAGGLRAERHQPHLAALASPDVQGACAQVDVLTWRATVSPARSPVSASSRTRASSRRSLSAGP
jgi:hypothetical protein